MDTSEQAQKAEKPLAFDKDAAAREIGVSRRTIERLIANGELESTRVGRRRLISTATLTKFLKRRHHPTHKPGAAPVGAAQ